MAAKGSPAKPRRRIDWEAIERDYRTGRFTLRELEAKYGPNNGTIGRRAEREGWTKDLSAAIRQATNAKVIAAATQQECSAAQQNAATVVLAAAELNKQIILGQQSRVGKALDVSMRMLSELDETTARPGALSDLLERVTEDADGDTLAQAHRQLQDLLRLHNRVGSLHKLMDSLGKAQEMERRVFRLDAGPNEDNDYESRLRKLDQEPAE